MERDRDGQRNHYQVLGVAPTASTAQIRSSYRQLAYLLHPDRQADATDAERRLAERRMREVNVAWTTLSDAPRRAEYDATIARTAGQGATVGGGSGPSGSPWVSGRSGRSGTAGAAGGRPAGAGGERDPGAWWDSDDPDAALARARASQLDADDATGLDDEVDVGHLWLLRRGPVIAMVLVALVIFVLTAYAGRGASGPTATSAPPPIDPTSDCIRVMSGQMAYRVSCSSNYDARIERKEPDARACEPDGFSYAVVGNESYCVSGR